MILFKGRKKGIIKTMNISLDDIRAIFFPKNFYEKYRYLGYIPHDDELPMVKALVLVMDYEAKPWWCPRFFLRFLHLFGSDNSIVRVRNFKLHNLEKKITKGILMSDYKTKWTDYDLRISIYAPKYIQDLSDAIESYTYRTGYKNELVEKIKKIQPDFNKEYLPNHKLADILEELENNNQ